MSVKVLRGAANDGGFMIPGNIHVTRKELEVLMLIAMGMGNGETAERLSISINTVRNHGYNVVKELGANSRAHAVVKAIENNMIKDKATEIEQNPFVVDHIKYEPPPELVCPYGGYEARLNDTWFWDEIKEIHPEYPDIPERNVVYHVRW